MDAIQKAIVALEAMLAEDDRRDYLTTPHELMCKQALTALREIEAVDVEGLKKETIKQATNLDVDCWEGGAAVEWTIDHLAANGYRIYKMGEKG